MTVAAADDADDDADTGALVVVVVGGVDADADQSHDVFELKLILR